MTDDFFVPSEDFLIDSKNMMTNAEVAEV